MTTTFYQPHPMMRRGDKIKILGVNGDTCIVSGEGMGEWGPELARHSTGLFDAPFKTNWGKGMFGQRYESWSPQRRDVVATFHIMNPVTGDSFESDPDSWHLVHSRFRALFGRTPEEQATIEYTSTNGVRYLAVRLLQEAKSFQAQPFEGLDPHLLAYGTVMLTLAAEIPYYQGLTQTFSHSGSGSTSFNLPWTNPSTIPIWPQWFLTAPATWTLPDYSFGWEEYGRGVADAGKTVTLPALVSGENVHVDSRPDTETIIAENLAPVGNRWAGKDLEYPIQPGANVTAVVSVTAPGSWECELDLPRWYAEPFSEPMFV